MTGSPRPASFSAEFEPAVALGRRRAPRAPVSLDARIGRGGLDRSLCRVVDLSEYGARLQTYSELRVGSLIWLTLPGVGPRSAEIRWATDFEAGCLFQQPLDETSYALLAGDEIEG